jgi:arsenite-transporting ATPase
VDCAPTGETLKLLSLPEVARWYLTHIFPVERMAARFASPIMRAVTDIPMPDDQLFDTIKELIQQLNRMADLLSDTKKSSVRVVLNPEKMVIKEAQRTFTYINLYGFACDLIVSNRVLPDITDSYFDALKESQARYGKLIEESFAPVPIFQVPFFDQEVVGINMLERMADVLYGDADPSQVFYEGSPQEIVKNGKGYLLKMKLPFAAKSDVHLTRAGDELAISVGNFRRNAILPRALAALEVKKARMEDGKLVVNFA